MLTASERSSTLKLRHDMLNANDAASILDAIDADRARFEEEVLGEPSRRTVCHIRARFLPTSVRALAEP